jgi:hypothetical protein
MATAPQISRLLKAAGFERSTSSKSRIKGLTEHSEGFKVTKSPVYANRVLVQFRLSSLSRPPIEVRRAKQYEALNKAREALENAGHHGRLITTQNGYLMEVDS